LTPTVTTPPATQIFRCLAVFCLLAFLAVPDAHGQFGKPPTAEQQLKFGVDMARRGLWSEALFRFRQADRLDPDNPRIQNNLAVALEATGQFEEALELYRRALERHPSDRELRRNYTRFIEFYQSYKPEGEGENDGDGEGAGAEDRAEDEGGV
jgi:Tfp pilus assembly protein PilF